MDNIDSMHNIVDDKMNVDVRIKILENVLFICDGNYERSPTFESLLKKNRPQYNVKSAGIKSYSPVVLTRELLQWADVVYVMSLEQEMFIYREFHEFLRKVVVIGCDDQYSGGSTELIHLVEYWINKVGL